MSATARATRTDPLAKVLLRRSGLAVPGLLTGTKVKDRGLKSVATAQGLVALEADVLARGYLVGPRLRAHLAGLAPHRLAEVGQALGAALAEIVGGDVPHVPLFRDFPRRIPADTQNLYVRRVFALLLQEPSQPCVLCGVRGLVRPVSPCAHLVCENCWDMGNYSGCPICHRRCDSFYDSLVPDEPATDPRVPLPRRAAVLEIAEDVTGAVFSAVGKLLERRTPPSPQDRDDLAVMLDFAGHGDLHWLPEEIPVRETRALVLARLVADPELRDRVPALLDTHVTTATDMLRLLYVLQGGDAGLVKAPPRRLSPRRALRRMVLARLDALGFPAVVEDLHRHPVAWLGLGEGLHPFEHAASFPRAATAFAALRRTILDETTPFGRVVVETAGRYPSIVHFDRSVLRLRVTTPASRVESALERGALETALRTLASRPGELARRLVALAHRAGGDRADLLAALRGSAGDVSPAVLIAAIGALRAAAWPAGTRLFLPRGGAARLWTEADDRRRLDAGLAAELESTITAELLRRARSLAPVAVATVDAELADLMIPFGERTASASLVRLTRGSSRPLPPGRTVRLFLHWTQPEGKRVDLDLSIAIFDGTGSFVGWCDYTRLRFGGRAAVHSGDLTSAPAPLGASEFVDLDLADLRRRGIRYLSMIVFSYNDVPFDAMTDAFAGFMGDPGRGGPFDAKAVEQRFDLTGDVRIAVPLVVDVEHDRMRWLDAKLTGSAGHGHNVGRNTRTLGRLVVAAEDYFAGGRRVSMWELACWHAAARAGLVQVRQADGTTAQYLRETDEPVEAFAARIVALAPADDVVSARVESANLAVLVRGDADVVAGSLVHALYRATLDADRVELLDAADLVGMLA